MMIFIANSESQNQKLNGWKFLLSNGTGKNKEAEELVLSTGQQLKGTVRKSFGCPFLIS